MWDATVRHQTRSTGKTKRKLTSLDWESPYPPHSGDRRRLWTEHNHQSQSTCDPVTQTSVQRNRGVRKIFTPHLLHPSEDILMGREFAIQTEELLLLLS